jgi:hypothetical protein
MYPPSIAALERGDTRQQSEPRRKAYQLTAQIMSRKLGDTIPLLPDTTATVDVLTIFVPLRANSTLLKHFHTHLSQVVKLQIQPTPPCFNTFALQNAYLYLETQRVHRFENSSIMPTDQNFDLAAQSALHLHLQPHPQVNGVTQLILLIGKRYFADPWSGFEEVTAQRLCTTITLGALSKTENAVTAIRTIEIRTDLSSPIRNRENARLESVRLVRDFLRQPEASLDATIPVTRIQIQPPRIPSLLWHVMQNVVPRILRPLQRTYDKLRKRIVKEQWTLMSTKIGDNHPPRLIAHSVDLFQADPFPIATAQGEFLFFEEFSYARSRGHIAVAPICPDGALGPKKTVLERPYHLSFPTFFSYHDEIFMLPEQSASGTLIAYRTDNFPYNWEAAKTIMAGVCAKDPILYEQNGTWWLFFSDGAFHSGDNNLYLFSSTCPFGPWHPHPQNPIVNTLQGARMAGALFRNERGELIRPGQDCRRDYGDGVILHKISALTPTRYHEELLQRIALPSNPSHTSRMHTYNILNGRLWTDTTQYNLSY